MGHILIAAALVLATTGGMWFAWFLRVNRIKGSRAMRWVEVACAGRGRITETEWLNPSQLRAHLRFSAHWFENARVIIRLSPRPIPFQWLLSVMRKQKETLTFEADLDYAPGFQLEVFRHRWFTQSRFGFRDRSKTWEVSRPGPVVLTTRTRWTHELTPVVNTLMTSRGHNLLTVRFRHQSPQFSASLPLEALSDHEAAAGFLSVLRELAAGASTQQT